MFTGLIEEVGRIGALRRADGGADLVIEAPGIGATAVVGESIAVNGVCLTVEAPRPGGFTCHAGAETLARTTIGELAAGAAVNLERALAVGGRLGGHFVQGHVDCVGEIVRRADRGSTVYFTVTMPEEYLRFVAEKGSIAVDGISLTVTEVGSAQFSVAIIPHTLAHTTLESAGRGQRVNIETDILAKYVLRYLGRGGPGGVTTEFLAEHGFI